MFFTRFRQAIHTIPEPFGLQTPGQPTQEELYRIRTAAEAYRSRVLGALLWDLISLPGNLLRRAFGRLARQVV